MRSVYVAEYAKLTPRLQPPLPMTMALIRHQLPLQHGYLIPPIKTLILMTMHLLMAQGMEKIRGRRRRRCWRSVRIHHNGSHLVHHTGIRCRELSWSRLWNRESCRRSEEEEEDNHGMYNGRKLRGYGRVRRQQGW